MKRRHRRPTAPADPLDQIMRLGYYVVQFSAYHCRIQDAVDFWPTTERWHDATWYRGEQRGRGMKALLVHLTKNHPLDERQQEKAA